MAARNLIKKIFNKFGLEIHRYNGSVLPGLNLPYEIMADCKLLPNREFALSQYYPLLRGGIMAEVGVAYGDFSRKIIDSLKPDKFYAIDIFKGGPGNDFWNRDDFSKLNLQHRDFIERKFKNEIDKGVFFTKKGLSWDVLETFDDDYFDYIYLDGAHDYESVKKDISVLLKKIKDKGIVQFNDYTFSAPMGVVRAVDEMLINNRHEIIYFCLHTGGFNDIVIRINK